MPSEVELSSIQVSKVVATQSTGFLANSITSVMAKIS